MPKRIFLVHPYFPTMAPIDAAFREALQMPIGDGPKFVGFTRKSLMDQYACTECARCSNFCPAYNTQKPLSPMHLIHDLRDEMIERGSLQDKIKRIESQIASQKVTGDTPLAAALAEAKKEWDELPPLVGGRIHDETLWACTTCGACQEVCPVFIDHPLKILQMRTHLVLTAHSLPRAVIAAGDPYEAQVRATADAIRSALDFPVRCRRRYRALQTG